MILLMEPEVWRSILREAGALSSAQTTTAYREGYNAAQEKRRYLPGPSILITETEIMNYRLGFVEACEKEGWPFSRTMFDTAYPAATKGGR